MKTENTCVNCASLECNVRYDCEDNELPTEAQVPKAESEEANVTIQVDVPKLTKKNVPENWVY